MTKLPLLLLLVASLAHGQRPQPVSVLAASLFLDPNGNTGIASVISSTDTTGVLTTSLFYSFCVQTTANACLEGNGQIPNAAFTGRLKVDFASPDVLALNVDTSRVPGFTNQICYAPDGFGGCSQGIAPATGGTVNLVFHKTPQGAETLTFTDKTRQNGLITLDSIDTTYQFSGQMAGTVLGVTANTAGITGIVGFGTSSSRTRLVHQSEMLRNWLKHQPFGDRVLRKLDALTKAGDL